MPRFDVYVAPGGVGYVLDVQADILRDLNTRVVVPLLPLSDAPQPAKGLNPVFQVADEPHVMVTQFMAAVPRTLLCKTVSNLTSQDSEIMAALDMILVGF